MDLIKDITKYFYPILIMVSCFLFVIMLFFSTTVYEKSGVFEGVGTLFASATDTLERKSDGISYIKNAVTTYVPVVKYVAGAPSSGSFVAFKQQLEVIREDGSAARGNVEDTFAIYLLDIKNKNGDSVLIHMTEDENTTPDEFSSPFVYDKENDVLHCFSSGVYIVYIKVYGENGGAETYEFQLPVEV